VTIGHIFVYFTKYYYDTEIKENYTGLHVACMAKMRNPDKALVGDYLRHLEVDGRIIIKRILNELFVKIWTEFT
jgi:hypothetical protein